MSIAPPTTPHAGHGDDALLLRRMAGGDERALGALYDRWQPLLHSVALAIVGDPDDAAEVLEETFWQAWRQAARYEPARGTVPTWLTMMVRSRALDRVRARRRQREDAVPELPETADGDGAAPDPLADAAQSERRRIVAEALGALPPEQRRTVELAFYGGMSHSEIAAHTGEPLGTVKTRVRLALRKLRDALSPLREDLA